MMAQAMMPASRPQLGVASSAGESEETNMMIRSCRISCTSVSVHRTVEA
jgi:hypothetical protein